MHEFVLALISGLIGGGLGAAAPVGLFLIQTHKRKKSLKAALAAEIASIVALAQIERMEEELRHMAHLVGAPEYPQNFSRYTSYATANYFSVFEASASDLGQIEARYAARIVMFYRLSQSLLDGLRAGVDQSGFTRDELARHYRQQADAIAHLKRFGDQLVRELAGPTMQVQISLTLLSLTSEDELDPRP